MTTNEKFTKWFLSQHFRYFKPEEFLSYFSVHRYGTDNSMPPEELWTNIVPTLRIVDDLRAHFAKPIVITSSYRDSDYNRKCGGATNSVHMQFQALDIVVSGHSPLEVATVLKQWRTADKFKGGLGLYNTFVHIDTRGYNATW